MSRVRPACNVPRLRQFFPRVRSIYVWALYSGTEVGNGWDPVHAVDELLTADRRTAVHVENEGWVNPAGDIISLELPGPVPDLWPTALYVDGRWHRFAMRTGNAKARACFLRGAVPPRTKVEVVPAEPGGGGES
jgi:hypothetical protein